MRHFLPLLYSLLFFYFRPSTYDIMCIAQLYGEVSQQSAGIPVPKPQHQRVYSQRDSSPMGYPCQKHHRTHSYSSVQGYSPEFLHPQPQYQWVEAPRYPEPSGHISQGHPPKRTGTIRVPPVGGRDPWAAPRGNHFTPAPGPITVEQQYRSSRSHRRYSSAAQVPPQYHWGHSGSSGSPSPASSRHSSRSSEKRFQYLGSYSMVLGHY